MATVTSILAAGRAVGNPSPGKVLVVGSSARTLELRDGRRIETGNYLNETVVPMLALKAAGYDLLVATPDGSKPHLDPRSVTRSHFGGDEAAFRAALTFYGDDPAFRDVRSLQSVVDAGLDGFAGVFVPGGHAPITDLATNPALGAILRHAHAQSKPTALICHGPIAALAAMSASREFEQALIAGDTARTAIAAANWQYRDYRMTIFSNAEEAPVERDVFGAPLRYSVADALRAAGGRVEHGARPFDPFVVVDRELITGQNPRSDQLVAARLVEALARRAGRQTRAAGT